MRAHALVADKQDARIEASAGAIPGYCLSEKKMNKTTAPRRLLSFKLPPPHLKTTLARLGACSSGQHSSVADVRLVVVKAVAADTAVVYLAGLAGHAVAAARTFGRGRGGAAVALSSGRAIIRQAPAIAQHGTTGTQR